MKLFIFSVCLSVAVAAERLDQGELEAWQKIWDHWDLGNIIILYNDYVEKEFRRDKTCRNNPCET